MAELIMQEEASAPSTPSSGKWVAYFKASGLYVKDDAGNEIGPLDSSNVLLTTGGTSTAYTITTLPATALITGETFRVKFHTTAGATPTLNRDGLGAKPLKYYDAAGAKQAATSAQIITDMILTILYDGTDYVILGGGSSGGSGGSSGGGVGKNLLTNGGMRVAQRGAGPFTSATLFPNNDDVFLIDGCVLLSNGNDTVDVSRVADTDFVSGYKIRLDVETANKRFGLLFPIENKDIQQIRHTGKASLQFKAKCTGSSMSNVRAYLLAWDSTADVITSDVISAWGSAGADPTFATNWTAENTASNLAVTTTIAQKEIANIVVDTASVANLAVLIIVDDTDATIGDYLEIGDVKLEAGEVCTTFEVEDYATALAKCRRNFEGVTFASANNNMAGLAENTSVMIGFFSYKVSKRVPVHTFTVGSALSDFTIRYTGAGTTVVTAFTMVNSGLESATHSLTGTGAPLTAGHALQLRAANANAALYYSAEL